MSIPKFDPFLSAKLRIDRAEEQLDTLEAAIDQFFSTTPYARVTEPDPNGAYEIHKIQLTQRFPLSWRILATEVVEHLRAALDHATWATAWLRTDNPYIEQAAFPFAKTASDLDHSMRRRSNNLPPEIQALLRTFQPYEGGNEALYTLNVLSNTSKHALVAFVAAAVFDFQISEVFCQMVFRRNAATR